MPASAAIIGKGTTIGYTAVGATGSPTAIGELKTINLPEVTVGNYDATHYGSPNSTVEKKSIVWKEISDLSGRINYVKTQYATLHTTLAGSEQTWTITLPDSSTFVFNGFVSKIGGNEIPNKSGIEADFAITVTGPVTFTAGS